MSVRKQSLVSLTLLGMLLLSSGCFNALFYAGPGAHLDMKVSSEPGTPFRVKIRNSYGFWGVFPRLKHFAVDEVVSEQLDRPVKNVSGLKIVQYRTFGYFMVQILTLGFYAPRTLVIEGVIHDEPPPGPIQTE